MYIYRACDCVWGEKSAITPIINRLVEKGWVERTRDEKDRRVIYLTLTSAGKVIFGEMEKKFKV
ncbi:MarR family transcriptional regulator [Niallia circulans]